MTHGPDSASRRVDARWAACLLTIAGLAASLPAQDRAPEAPPAKASDEGRGKDGPGNERGRAREQVREDIIKRLEQAKERIAKGEAPADVMRELFPRMAGRMGGQRGEAPEGGPREGGPREGEPWDEMGGPGQGPGDGPDGNNAGPRPRRGLGGQMGGPMGGPEGRMGPANPMNPEQIERAMEFMQDNMPQLHERLVTFRDTDPVGFERLINRMGPKIREAAGVKERDPALYELRAGEIRSGIQVLENARAYHDAKRDKDTSPEKLESAKKSLREALQAQYESRLAAQAHEIRSLSRRVEKLQGDLDKSKADREKIVDGLLEQITKGKEPRDLPFPPPGRRPGGPGGGPDGRPGEPPRKPGDR